MKRSIYILLTAFTSLIALSACNSFLDEVPDKRAELDTPEKCAQILISAYPTALPIMMCENMSDNVDDNGPNYPMYYDAEIIQGSYFFEDYNSSGNDSPSLIWQHAYIAIAAANQALEAIEKLDDPAAADGIKAEALLCRAFGHFTLANTFCMPYNPESSETDMGIPYVVKPETTVSPKYERGTVAEVYEKIDRDIEEALPLLSESHITQLKYHFNKRAAYAFAARFNLYYGKWEKVVQYATQAIGEDPTDLLRDWSKYKSFTNPEDWAYMYINTSEASNFLLVPTYSNYGLIIALPQRYGHNLNKMYQTLFQFFPWDDYISNIRNPWGNSQVIYWPEIFDLWEIIDPVAQVGYIHCVVTVFQAEETLACRAEANAMLHNYEAAANDLNYWYRKNSPNGSSYTVDQIADYYSTSHIYKEELVYERPVMKSRFGIEEGIQENLIHAVLAFRRFEGLYKGLRFSDIKRHGIEVKHINMITNTVADTIVLKPYDPRTAIQLPQDVIFAGLPANPR